MVFEQISFESSRWSGLSIKHFSITVSPRLLNPGLNSSSVVCISAVKRAWSLIFFQVVQLVFVYIENQFQISS
jgi:hypothetical protein